jgi:hypothetical protein
MYDCKLSVKSVYEEMFVTYATSVPMGIVKNINIIKTLIEAIRINYDLLPKSSLNVCFSKLLTNIRLPMLINYDCKIVRETPKNILLHTKLENRAISTRHLSLELSTNMTNLTARNVKSFKKYITR